MLSTWAPDEAVAPTLLVKATDSMTGVDRNGDWQANWTPRHTDVEIPGTHLTILEERADATARAIEEWLARNAVSGARRKRSRRLRPRALVRR